MTLFSLQVQPFSWAWTRPDFERDQILYRLLGSFRIVGSLRTEASKCLGGYWVVFRIHQTPNGDDLLIAD